MSVSHHHNFSQASPRWPAVVRFPNTQRGPRRPRAQPPACVPFSLIIHRRSRTTRPLSQHTQSFYQTLLVLGHVTWGHGRLAGRSIAHARAQWQVGELALKAPSELARHPLVQNQIPLVRATEPLHLLWTRLPPQRPLATVPATRFWGLNDGICRRLPSGSSSGLKTGVTPSTCLKQSSRPANEMRDGSLNHSVISMRSRSLPRPKREKFNITHVGGSSVGLVALVRWVRVVVRCT